MPLTTRTTRCVRRRTSDHPPAGRIARLARLAFTALSLAAGARALAAPLPVFPLRSSADGHYLVDSAGTPFRIHGDTGWDVVNNLTAAEVDTYLADRQAKGFNTILLELFEHRAWVAGSPAPANRGGAFPFLRDLSGATYTSGNQAADVSTPNDAFFAFADTVLSKAAARGMLVLVTPAYLGFGAPTTPSAANEGWSADMLLSGTTKCQALGAYLGNRYRTFTNVIWVEAGDQSLTPGSAMESCVNAVMAGILGAGATQLQTAHWSRTRNSTDEALPAGPYGVNSAYVLPVAAGGAPYTQARRAYARTPAIPAYVIEDYYEGEHGTTAAQLRYEAWGDVLSAIGGYVFGNLPIWPFGSGWPTALGATGSLDMQRMGAFLDSLPWHTLVPTTTLVTAGAGSEASGSFVTAALAANGALAVAYLPATHTGPVTVDMTKIAGQVRARWLDPTASTFTTIGVFPNTAPQSFTTPGTNAAGAGDWVLVLDLAAATGALTVSPASATVAPGGTVAFTASGGSGAGFVWSFATNASGATLTSTGGYTAGPTGGVTDVVKVTDSLGNTATASVTVTSPPAASGFAVKINFQLATTPTPAGYLPDTGLAFGNRGNGFTYGWNVDNTAQARERNAANSPDKRYDTLNQLQRPANPNAFWEIAVPNGTYAVRIVAGDPGFTDSVYGLLAEGVLAVSGTPTLSQLWFDRTVTVTVGDGRLTVAPAPGSSNDKICFIEIGSVGTANQAPTVAAPAAASPNPVTGTSTALSVIGADDGGEAALTYTWSTVGTPPAPVTFGAQGTNAAKSTTATFARAGTYTLRATIKDAAGLAATSDVLVTVTQTLASLVVSPASAAVATGGTQAFTATARDQFGQPLAVQPAVAWSGSGGGTISASGVFTAGTVAGGPFTVTASAGGKTGTASVTVTAGFAVKINFQLATTATPAGYLPDTGLAFGPRGNGFTYGWNADNTAQARERNAASSPDERYDTLNQLQRPASPNAFWEIAVPNGTYAVRIVAGDPSFTDSVYGLLAEGVLAVSGTPALAQPWFDGTATVTVADGRLTVISAPGSSNNKICFIEITSR